MDKCTLAYLAGVIDSDGTIGVKRQTYAVRVLKNSSQPTYVERVCVKQVTSQAVDLLYSTFGGYRSVTHSTAKYGRTLQVWQVTNLKAAVVLEMLLPYLRIKRRQAENALALRQLTEQSKKDRVAFGRGVVGSLQRPKYLSTKMEQRYLKAKALNRVGVA